MNLVVSIFASAPVVLFGLGWGAMSMSPPEYSFARWLIIGSSISAIIWYFSWLWLTDEPVLVKSVFGVAIGLVFLGGLPYALNWIDEREKISLPTPIQAVPADEPDVTLRFIYPKSPALVLVNQSNAVAREIKWTVALWNIDNPKVYSNSTTAPDVHEPLQIPISTFDFIRPHDTGGPQNLFGSSLVSPYVKPGDHLFGSASVICPTCSRGHTFIVYIVWGEGGWYWEKIDEKSGKLFIPRFLKTADVKSYFNELTASIPIAERIPIEELR